METHVLTMTRPATVTLFVQCLVDGCFPEVAEAMVDDKIDNIVASGADTVVGGDMGCLMNIDGRLCELYRRAGRGRSGRWPGGLAPRDSGQRPQPDSGRCAFPWNALLHSLCGLSQRLSGLWQDRGIGGQHAYGSAYSGPVGAVVTPLLASLGLDAALSAVGVPLAVTAAHDRHRTQHGPRRPRPPGASHPRHHRRRRRLNASRAICRPAMPLSMCCRNATRL